MTTTRSVQNFFEELGDPEHLFRYIRVQRDEEGKKKPFGEMNNMTEAEVRDKRGDWGSAPDNQKYLASVRAMAEGISPRHFWQKMGAMASTGDCAHIDTVTRALARSRPERLCG